MLRLFTWFVTAALMAVPQPTVVETAIPTSSDFPPQDEPVYRQLERGLVIRLAERRRAEAPSDLETLRLLSRARDVDGMIEALHAVVATHPERIPDALEAAQGVGMYELRSGTDAAEQRSAALAAILAETRTKLPDLPREAAARAAMVLLRLEGDLSPGQSDYWRGLDTLIDDYRGTETAAFAEIQRLVRPRTDAAVLAALDGFIAAHPASTAGARALYEKGFQLSTGNSLGTIYAFDADPFPRFARVRDIVDRMRSGDYPESEWVRRAPVLITDFYVGKGRLSDEEARELIDTHIEVALEFLATGDPDRVDRARSVLAWKLPRLVVERGGSNGDVERLFDDIDRRANRSAVVRYLRALYYLDVNTIERTPDAGRPGLVQAARAILESLVQDATSSYRQRALATLAAMEFDERNYAAAAPLFEEYIVAYPDSPWTWLARLRRGQCAEALHEPATAAATFEDVARRYANLPLARVLGLAYAAGAREATGEFDAALADRRAALAAWDDSYGLRYTSDVRPAQAPMDPFAPRVDSGAVEKADLEEQTTALARALSVSGGEAVAKARSLIAQARHEEAVAALEPLVRQADGPLRAEASSLLHQTQLEQALALADAGSGTAAARAAAARLDALAKEPTDFFVTAARIARASLFWTNGAAGAGATSMAEALESWLAAQPARPAQTDLERDVVAIREAVFLPQGGGVYDAPNATLSWPPKPTLYSVVNPDVRVRLSDGTLTTLSVTPRPPASAGQVLFFDSGELDTLKRVIVALGGTRRREPQHVMEVPNQPVGDSMRILDLWTRFFPGRPGHWGGWDIETAPVVNEIVFSDAARTRAIARVTIGYTGGTVVLEKRDGAWVALKIVDMWIT